MNKQETLEELAKDFYSDENQLMERIAFKRGYTECKENSYSEEEVLDLLYKRDLYLLNRDEKVELELPDDWFEQFKEEEFCHYSGLPSPLAYIEEPKQETLEEAIKREYETRKFNSDFPFDPQSFKLGAKWQQERMYSEEEVEKIVRDAYTFGEKQFRYFGAFKEWFEQFKKK